MLQSIRHGTVRKKRSVNMKKINLKDFQFYRDDINRFFSLLNNLIVNKAYQDSFIRNVDTKENIDPTKLLPTELNAEEARDMLKLFTHRNDRSTSLSDHKAYNDPSRYYIYNLEAAIWLFNSIREYECIISNAIADFTPLFIFSFNNSNVTKSKNGLNLFPPFKIAYSMPLAIVSG